MPRSQRRRLDLASHPAHSKGLLWDQHPLWLALGEVLVAYGFLTCPGFWDRVPCTCILSPRGAGRQGDGSLFASPQGQLLSKLRDASSLSDVGCGAPPHLCHVRYAGSYLCHRAFGVSFTSPLPPHHPNPIPGEGTGHRPADQGPAALPPRTGSGEGHSGDNQERRRQSRLWGAPSRRVTPTHGVHVLAHPGQGAWHGGSAGEQWTQEP